MLRHMTRPRPPGYTPLGSTPLSASQRELHDLVTPPGAPARWCSHLNDHHSGVGEVSVKRRFLVGTGAQEQAFRHTISFKRTTQWSWAPLPEPLAYPSRKGSHAGSVQEVRGSPLPLQLQPRVWPSGARGTQAQPHSHQERHQSPGQRWPPHMALRAPAHIIAAHATDGEMEATAGSGLAAGQSPHPMTHRPRTLPQPSKSSHLGSPGNIFAAGPAQYTGLVPDLILPEAQTPDQQICPVCTSVPRL